jgi:hypothetical protein
MSVAFDTLKFMEKLESGGFSHDQAKAAAQAFADATGEQLATKADLVGMESRLREADSAIKSDVAVSKWMNGFVLAIVVALLFLSVRH